MESSGAITIEDKVTDFKDRDEVIDKFNSIFQSNPPSGIHPGTTNKWN